MPATLPTNFVPDHAPTAAEMAQILNAVFRITNIKIFNSLGGCSLSTTSATYVDVTNANTSWTKNGGSADSDVAVYMAVDVFSTAVTTVGQLGIGIGGTDSDVKLAYMSQASILAGTHVGFTSITGIAAGAYTPKVRARRNSGAGTVTIDVNCTVSFLVGELPK
jgi:hypothetical protein